jgi:hypothetical protein
MSELLMSIDLYEVRPRKDHRGLDLISDALPFGRLWYGEPKAISNAIGYAKHRSRSHNAMIRVYDESGNLDSRGTNHTARIAFEIFRETSPRSFRRRD